jgi:hypothetical protein
VPRTAIFMTSLAIPLTDAFEWLARIRIAWAEDREELAETTQVTARSENSASIPRTNSKISPRRLRPDPQW